MFNGKKRLLRAAQLAMVFLTAGSAQAAVIRFDADPFGGTTVLQTPGRQVVGGELFIPTFDLATDVIAFDAAAFKVDPVVRFANDFATGLPVGGVNAIVLRNDDFDGVASNGRALNAVQSADLIAGRITEEGAGFFVYFNTALDLNRLVYSTDLSSSSADLKIVARFLDQAGQGGIDVLPQWSASNFTAVPEPATASLVLAGLAGLAIRRRRAANAAL